MNPYLMYQLYQIERVKTRDEVIEANARLGEIAAASARLRRDLVRRAWLTAHLALRNPARHAPQSAGRVTGRTAGAGES